MGNRPTGIISVESLLEEGRGVRKEKRGERERNRQRQGETHRER